MTNRTSRCRRNRYQIERIVAAFFIATCFSSLHSINSEAILIEDEIYFQNEYKDERDIVEVKPQNIESINTFEQSTFKPLLVEGNVGNYDLRKPSNISIQQADELLKGTKLEGLGKAYVEAEIKYRVNALYLISHSALESGWGTSNLAVNKNNLFGISAYDGDAYDSGSNFSSKEECILWIAEYISKEYLKKDGEHYNGPTLKGMNVKYASDKEWSDKIAQIMFGLQDDLTTSI